MLSNVMLRLVRNCFFALLFFFHGCASTNLENEIHLRISYDIGNDYVLVLLENSSNKSAKFFDTLGSSREIPYYSSFMVRNGSGERVPVTGENDEYWWSPEVLEGSLPPLRPWQLATLPPNSARQAKIRLADIKSKISAAANDDDIFAAKMRVRIYLDRYGRRFIETESDWIPL